MPIVPVDPVGRGTRAQLIEQDWGPGWFGDEQVVDVPVKNLRAELDRPGQIGFVKTVRAVGYRFDRAGGTDSAASSAGGAPRPST